MKRFMTKIVGHFAARFITMLCRTHWDCGTSIAHHDGLEVINTADRGRAQNERAPSYRRAEWRKDFGAW
jgi:hypothetical protein